MALLVFFNIAGIVKTCYILQIVTAQIFGIAKACYILQIVGIASL
jgi:hypothetical protein